MARVYVRKEVRDRAAGDWQLCFQWCCYDLDDGVQYGYRFIWRTPEGKLQAARGQARIPSIEEGKSLMDRAIEQGWGERNGDEMKHAATQLEERGCVVELGSGYVGWPNKDAAANGRMTPEMMEWEKIIREWA